MLITMPMSPVIKALKLLVQCEVSDHTVFTSMHDCVVCFAFACNCFIAESWLLLVRYRHT